MKHFFTSIKAAVALVATTAVLASSMVSCMYDDTKIWKEIGQIKQEISDLRTQVENELNALNELVSGMTTVTSVVQQSDGSTEVTLSSGKKLIIYPKGADVPANVVTVTEVDGVLYWAYYDGLGNAQLITVDGKNVPVGDVAPQTQVNADTGAIEVSFDGGITWITTGYSESPADALFVGIDVVYSDWQTDEEGNPLALYCVITLNDGSAIKVGMQNGRIILPYDSVFAAYGNTTAFVLDVEDAADFMTQIPAGWECEVAHDVKAGTMQMLFTAPTMEEVEAGGAVSEGIAKLMVVFNNGSSAIARIKLSTDAAKMTFTESGIYINVGYSVNYMLYGIVENSQFNAYHPKILEWIPTILDNTATETSNARKFVREIAFMETTEAFVTYKDAFPNKMVAGTDYVFWYIVPRTDAEDNLYIVDAELMTVGFTHTTTAFEVTKTDFLDVEIKFDAKGTKGYMLGYDLAENFDAAAIATYYVENPDYLYFTEDAASYTGSFLELFDPYNKYLLPDTEYTAWYITDRGSQVVIEDNVRNWTFKTAAFSDGGSVTVSTSNTVVEYTSVSTTLSTTAGHIAMYYMLMPSNQATAYPDDNYRKEALLRDGTRVISSEPVQVAYKRAKAGEKLTLLAMAVGADGKYGKVYVEEFTTKKFEYNNLALTLTLVDYKVDDTKIKVECEGAEKFVYVYTTTDSNDWADFGGTAKKTGEFIIANPNDSRICDTSDERYALQDGHIVLNGLTMDKEYAVIVMAVDAEGKLSQPKSVYFEPIANIGTVVRKGDANWEVGKPELILGGTLDSEFFNVTWYIAPQEGYTAYSVATNPNIFNDEYYGLNIDSTEKLIAYIISQCDTGDHDEGHVCEYNPDGYSRSWRTMEDLNNDGIFGNDEYVVHTEEGLPGVYNSCFYGTKDETLIFTTWVGSDGNFHEPFVYDPTQEMELTDWKL